MDYSPPSYSVHGISQARILEWVVISFSKGSSRPRDGARVSCFSRQIPYHWATWEAPKIEAPTVGKKISALSEMKQLGVLAKPHLHALNSWCLRLNRSRTESITSLPLPPKYPQTLGLHQQPLSWEMVPCLSRDWIRNLATAVRISSIWSLIWFWSGSAGFISGVHLLLSMSTAT